MKNSTGLRLAVTVTTIMLAACASNEPLNSHLDTSGLTMVTLDEAVVLARPTPRLTTAARDYVYLGPVEINRMGEIEHYVWIGMASTVDRPLAGAALPRATTLALVVDGMPMTFPVLPWGFQLDRAPYESAVPVYDSLAARASLNQIARIAAAESIEVHIITETGVSAAYHRWRGDWPHWSAFGAEESIQLRAQAKR